MKTAHEYHRKAEECRKRADGAVHPDDKTGWLQVAQDWSWKIPPKNAVWLRR